MIYYRDLQLKDLHSGMLKTFIRYQETTHIFRRTAEGLMMDSVQMISDWDEAARERIIEEDFKSCIQDGTVLGAFDEDRLIGFAVVPGESYGRRKNYKLLTMCHVSADYRGKGIGTQLFNRLLKEISLSGCSRLYISSHPSMQTQLFYKKMGCTLASEYIAEVSDASPSDIPLEYHFK